MNSVQSPHAPRPLLQVSCAAAAACHLTVTCPAPRLSRPATPQLAAPWTATLTTPAWPTWEARPRSSTAPLPTRLTPVSAHVSNHTLHLRWCFLTLSATLFWENMNGNCAEVTYHGVVLAALWKKKTNLPPLSENTRALQMNWSKLPQSCCRMQFERLPV